MKGSIMLVHSGDVMMNTHSAQALNEAFDRLGYHFHKKENKRRKQVQKARQWHALS